MIHKEHACMTDSLVTFYRVVPLWSSCSTVLRSLWAWNTEQIYRYLYLQEFFLQPITGGVLALRLGFSPSRLATFCNASQCLIRNEPAKNQAVNWSLLNLNLIWQSIKMWADFISIAVIILPLTGRNLSWIYKALTLFQAFSISILGLEELRGVWY